MTEKLREARKLLATAFRDAGHPKIAEWVGSGLADESTHTPALNALVAALTPKADQGVEGWLPIETAPRPHIPVMLYHRWGVFEGYLGSSGLAFERNSSRSGRPWVTHWQPLPPPPSAEPTP